MTDESQKHKDALTEYLQLKKDYKNRDAENYTNG